MLTRQAQFQRARVKRGECAACGKVKHAKSKRHCGACLERIRARRRKTVGCKAWKRGGPGRPPMTGGGS